MNKSILLIGANGQLGSDLVKILNKEKFSFIPLHHNVNDGKNFLDITNYEDVKKVINHYRPSIVINTAAFNRVDECEINFKIAYNVNAYSVRNLAILCKDRDITLVHFSTDYIFDGNKNQPYNEQDNPNPLNKYGDSKLAGEEFINNISLEKKFIIRTSALQGIKKSSSKGTNFIETILKKAKENNLLEIVNDQITTPTYTFDLAKKTFELIQTENYGTYHITNNGECSWYDFTKYILELSKLKVNLLPISSDEAKKKFNYKAERPRYSVLDNFNLRQLGLDNLRTWDKALIAYLEEREK